KSRPMEDVFKLIESVAQYNTTVLIQGENGTGKELAAEAIHALSPRKDRALIKLNCSALPETLLESELFGHEKGAFTDAARRKIGRFELAEGGSIFLDDIDDMKPAAQVKLLRVLQQREFERVGGTETIKADVRVISATKADLKERIKEGTFREDLYYRLNVVQVNLPPLRDRGEDIPQLADHFLKKFNNLTKKTVELTPQVLQIIGRYYWPGNIRELENLIEKLVSLSSRKEIIPEDLPPYFFEKKEWKAGSLASVVKQAEKEHILLMLEHAGGVKKNAAEQLGISTKTLWEKMKEFGID
ncbi:MAG: sigma-54 dependent transcriptional regulator, partial [Candidatus Firestonebacteria bacterium]